MFRNSRKPSEPAPPPPPSSGSGGPDRQRILLEAMADLSSTLDLEQVLDRILARGLEVCEAERALLLLAEGGGGLLPRRAMGAGGKPLAAEDVLFSSTLVQRALRESRPVVQELDSDSQALAVSQSVFELRLRSVMCAPLCFRDQVMGAIYVDSRVQKKTFSSADRDLFEALARQAAIAIQNARLLVEAQEKSRLHREMEIAAEIQGDLLPKVAPTMAGLDLHGRSLPCEDISGDFFDFILLPGGQVVVYVADVVGHGVGPALLAAEVRGEIRALVPIDPDPGLVLSRVHRNLRETMDPGRFLTLFLALLDPAAGTLAYANAGHPEALLYQGRRVEWLSRTGPPLGVDTDARHDTRAVAGLGAGDGLLLYSDGLIEARNDAGELFGTQRLEQAADRAAGGAAAMVEALLAEVARFNCGPRNDDRTAVVVRWQ